MIEGILGLPDGKFSIRFALINIVGHDITSKPKIGNFALPLINS